MMPLVCTYYATGNIDLCILNQLWLQWITDTAMIATLLHEVAHIIDANARILGEVEYAQPATYRDSRSNVLGFENTRKFEASHSTVFKDKPDYSEYYTKNIEKLSLSS